MKKNGERPGPSAPRGVLLDLDGVLYVGDRLLPGARETLGWLEARGIQRRFLTNTSTKSVGELVEKLNRLGLTVQEDEVFSAVSATRAYLEEACGGNPGETRVALLIRDAAKEDFAGFAEGTEEADYVVVGDIGAAWSYDLLNRVFRMIMNGARLVAMHRNRYWEGDDGLRMDIGAFVAGLEYVTGKKAVVVGKPSEAFFGLALSSMRMEKGEVVMVGDDVSSDIGGSQAAGIRGVLVRTGKYREGDESETDPPPAAVIDSIADLPEWIERGLGGD